MGARLLSHQTSALSHVVLTPDPYSYITNPERGFYIFQSDSSDPAALSSVRTNYASWEGALVCLHLALDAYTASDVDATYLNKINTYMAAARTAGLKVIPSAAYASAYIGGVEANGSNDAALPQVLRHIAQFGDIWKANADIIAYEHCGYIGTFGEWHDSNQIGPSHNTSSVYADWVSQRAEVANAVLAAQNVNRHVLLRYPVDLYNIRGPSPLTASEAFSGTNRARLGHYNLGFNSSPDDFTTYSFWGVPTYASTANAVGDCKAWLAKSSLYTPCSGEAASEAYPSLFLPDYPGGVTAKRDLALLNYSSLDSAFDTYDFGVWQQTGFGCIDDKQTIVHNLGYRIELQDAYFQPTATRGALFYATVNLINRGYASMFNARPVYFVLTQGAYKLRLPIGGPNTDIRLWQPGVPIRIATSFTLPTGMPTGNYDLHLEMPDGAAMLGLPNQSITEDPRYSVLCANANVRNTTTGLNLLASTAVTIN